MSEFGDILLDNKPYRIDFESWRGKDIIDFSPRASVPGGSFVMSDLGLLQPLVQTDWRHGFGFHWYSDALGYMNTVGNIDTRQEGLAMLFTKSAASDTDNNVKEGQTVFNNAVYSWGAAGLRKYSGGAWTSIYSTVAVNFAMAAGDYLFFCPDGLRIRKIDTSDTVTDAGLNSDANDFKWLIVHNGYVYAGKDGTNAVHFDNSETLSTLQGNSSDTNRIPIGLGNSPTIGAEVYNGNLYIRKRDGVWVLGEDRIARRVLDFSAEASDENLRSVGLINGFYVFALRDRILQWNGARVSDITPQKLNDTFPYTTYGRFDNFVAVGDFLYVTARTNEATYNEDLICWDGVGWHKLMNLVSNGTDTITMQAYEAVNNRLWYHLDATADITYYIQFQNRSTFPYADFPTSGQHSLVSSRLDMGFRRVIKSASKLTIEARGVSSTTYIKVYYSLDGSSWVFWQDVKDNGMIDLKNPGGSRTVEFNYMQLRFDFVTGSASLTPILEGWTLHFIMRPQTTLGYNFSVIAATHGTYGRFEDYRTAKDILDEIKAVRNSKAPVELVDMQGLSHIGYVTAIQETPVFSKVDDSEEGRDDIEYRYQVNFVVI